MPDNGKLKENIDFDIRRFATESNEKNVFAVLFIYLFILLYKSFSKYKKKIQQSYKNKHTQLQIEKLCT